MSKSIKIHEDISTILSKLPKSPGVYQMKNAKGEVMYVGKAKNLKNRVSSYFAKTSELSLAKRQMVGKIADIETILCETEVEALVLETNIIKHLSPKYNILMKDDKNLAYLKITHSPIPELIKTRIKSRDGGEYFGPFVSSVEESVRALRRIFRIRNCKVKFSEKKETDKLVITDKAGRTIPCMDYYIGLCPAPCILKQENIKTHSENIAQVRAFLNGDALKIFDQLEYDMREKARQFQFEEAQKIKETLECLRGLHERQKVRDFVDGDIDIFVKYEKYEKVYIGLTQIRGGQIIGVFRHEAVMGADDEDDIAISFLARQYIDDENLPDRVLTYMDIKDEVFIAFLKWKGIQHEVPKIGSKYELLEFTINQVKEYAYKKELATLETRTLTREHMVHTLERIGYPVPKNGEIVFECYDISHTDGHFTYASRVAIANGKPDTKRYKKYKIQSLKDGDIDDFASHREVMRRRTLEGLEYHNFPHLIIIDGGKGQLSSAIAGIHEGIKTFQEQNDSEDAGTSVEDSFSAPPICSIAKREEEVFLPGKRTAIVFEKGIPELMVLQKARDESHRFSITANKSARMKSMKKNILEELPGFGPVTRKKLLKLAGNIDEIKNIEFEELQKICTGAQIQVLKDHGLFP